MIPPERVELETRLIVAMERGAGAIADTLETFSWRENRELTCLGLGELAKRELRLAVSVSAWCARASGAWCARCPLALSRAASLLLLLWPWLPAA